METDWECRSWWGNILRMWSHWDSAGARIRQGKGNTRTAVGDLVHWRREEAAQAMKKVRLPSPEGQTWSEMGPGAGGEMSF